MSTLNNQTKAAFMHREGSYSTRGSRNGANLLGWDFEEEESLTLIQEKDCLASRYRYLHDLVKQHPKGSIKRKELGKEMLEVADMLNRIKKQLHGVHSNRGLDNYIVDVFKERLSRIEFEIVVKEAKRRKIKNDELLYKRTKGWRDSND